MLYVYAIHFSELNMISKLNMMIYMINYMMKNFSLVKSLGFNLH